MAKPSPLPAQPAEPLRRSVKLPPMLRSLLRNPGGLLSAVLLLLAVLSAIFAPQLTPQGPIAQDLMHSLAPPGTAGHLFGTDALGRDVLARVIYGGRVSLEVGFYSVIGALVLGSAAGVVAGYYGGIVDDLLMRLADVQLAFPFLLLALIIVAALGPSLRNLVLVLVLQNWVTFARVVRGQVLEVRELEFIDAARAIGEKNLRILLKHVLPQVTGSIIAVSSFTMAAAMISEAALSFLGAGVPPPAPSWGGMLHENLLYIGSAWWTIVLPALALTLVVLSLNVFGDWLRDVLDPTLRGR